MRPKNLGGKKTSCKKTAVQNILQIHYSQAESLWTQHVKSKCFKAFTPQWLSDEICKKEKNLTECPQNIVLPQVFCFPAFYRVFHSQGITSVSEYLMAEAMETLLRLLIVEILLFASCAPRFFTSNLICVLLIFFF